MSKVGPEGRSFAPITSSDLHRLREIALNDRRSFFAKHTKWSTLYLDRLLCIALCQGAALHYLRGDTGINDFDVYLFYSEHPEQAWYAKRIKSYDFGDAKFGQSIDKPRFVGRRVDILGRSILASPGDDPMRSLQNYLRQGNTQTARLLSEKAVVLLEPVEYLEQVIWPMP